MVVKFVRHFSAIASSRCNYFLKTFSIETIRVNVNIYCTRTLFLSILINVFQTSLLFLYKRKRVQTSGRFDASNKAHRTRFRRNNRWTRLQTYLRNTSFYPFV